ncbi:hypothetical protein [Thioclava indica]|uniref:Uncharacterized protein n=1 Tax=Thioclava indica TaxID=1353528 RepID=A0A074JT02_9RHOB|nr:hypothetical protein [Thioclava indica]KEO60806.1 hypothetical protein DT23_12035 [Thioclava indica]
MKLALFAPMLLVCFSTAQAQDVNAQSQASGETYYDNRSTARDVITSYYNAINLSQYARAFSYKLRGTPEGSAEALNAQYALFRDGFAHTAHVRLRLGQPVLDAGMSKIYSAVPVVIEALSDAGKHQVYSGCYTLVQVSASVQDYVPFDPIRIVDAKLVKISNNFKMAPMPDCRL